MGWIIIGEIRSSTTSPRHRPSLSAQGSSCGRKSWSSECEASINQHNPSFERMERGTNADDAVQRKSNTWHRGAAMDCHGCNVSVGRGFIGPSIGVVFGSRRSATLRCGWMSVVTCTREDTHGDVYADGGGRNPSRITRIEARGRVSSRLLKTSQVRRATAGSRANLNEHGCDAKWVMCPCSRDGCLGQRECAGRRRSPAFTRKEPAGKQRAPT